MGRYTNILLLANLLVFLLVFSMPESMRESVFLLFSFSQGTLIEFWRIFTSLFLHVSASHFFFNMLGLYFFGRVLEEDVSGKKFLLIYFAAGIIGNIVFMLTSASPVVGASGAMFGVLGAAMLLNPARMIHLYVFPLPLGMIAITFLIFETLVVYFQPAEFADIANTAHLGGIAVGAFSAFLSDWKKSLKGIAVLIICLLLLLFLGPVFALITGIGGMILGIIETVAGFFLYNIAGLLSFLWV